MGPEIIKRIKDKIEEKRKPVQIPLEMPMPDWIDREDEEVSVISHIIEIDL